MRYGFFNLICDTGRAAITKRCAKLVFTLASFIKNPFSQSSHIRSAEIICRLVDNCQYFLNCQTLNIFRCGVLCQTKQDIWKNLELRETAWKLWSTLKWMEIGNFFQKSISLSIQQRIERLGKVLSAQLWSKLRWVILRHQTQVAPVQTQSFVASEK